MLSAFVATVLLIGLTIAVGSILSIFFISLERRMTGEVETVSACGVGILQVSVPRILENSILVEIVNKGNKEIRDVSISVICGGNKTSAVIPLLNATSIAVTDIEIKCEANYSDIDISVVGTCKEGGTTISRCSKIACKP